MSLTVNDTRADLTGRLTSDGEPAVLTGATLAVHLKPPGEAARTVAGAIVDATDGTWSYRWVTGDLDVAGKWRVEVQVTYSDGGIQTFGPASFTVKPEIA